MRSSFEDAESSATASEAFGAKGSDIVATARATGPDSKQKETEEDRPPTIWSFSLGSPGVRQPSLSNHN